MLFFKNPIIENFQQPNGQPLDEIAVMYEKVIKDLPQHFKVDQDVLNSFKIKDTLNPEFWHDGKINPAVQHKLMKIAHDFFKTLELPPKIKLLDVLFVGSMANYNWSKFSDVDLHLVVDFKKFDEEGDFIKKSMDAFKNLYNTKHNIKIAGYDVEVYVQDLKEKLSAAAVYSLAHNKWILKPHDTKFKLDKAVIKRKLDKIFDKLKNIKKNYDNKKFQKVTAEVQELKDVLKKMRKSGLEKGGEFSSENIVYKILRRTEILELLDNYKNKAYDQSVTL